MARNPFEPYTDPDEYKIPEPPPPGPPVKHEDVVTRVRELIGKYPTIGSRQLYDLAVRMHPDLETHGFRSFHARYVLPLKREIARAEGRVPKRRKTQPEAAPAAPRKRTARSEKSADAAEPATASVDERALRARAREVLLRLAREVAVADSRADLVDALARVESMVDEIVAAVSPSAQSAEQTES